MVSIIEMGATGWWRGKQGLKVGSFPSQCVRRINSATDVMGTHERPFSPPAYITSAATKPSLWPLPPKNSLCFSVFTANDRWCKWSLCTCSCEKTRKNYGFLEVIFSKPSFEIAAEEKRNLEGARVWLWPWRIAASDRRRWWDIHQL